MQLRRGLQLTPLLTFDGTGALSSCATLLFKVRLVDFAVAFFVPTLSVSFTCKRRSRLQPSRNKAAGCSARSGGLPLVSSRHYDVIVVPQMKVNVRKCKGLTRS
jgi:hypothetical protein